MTTETAAGDATWFLARSGRRGISRTLHVVLAPLRAKVAAVVLVAIVLVCVVGPWASPHGPSEVVGAPFTPPSQAHLLGTDFLGRDAFSRFLAGGRLVLLIAVLATCLAYLVAVPLGVIAGLRHGRRIDLVVVVLSDIVYALPPLILLLMLLAATGPGVEIVAIGIALTHIPRVLRIARLATIDLAQSEFVEASMVRGDGIWAVSLKDIVPNILTPMLTDFGVRLSVSIMLYASLSYLGLGPEPPTPDWGLIISENRVGLQLNPWVAAAPALAVAAFAVSVNVLADGFARTFGRSLANARTAP